MSRLIDCGMERNEEAWKAAWIPTHRLKGVNYAVALSGDEDTSSDSSKSLGSSRGTTLITREEEGDLGIPRSEPSTSSPKTTRRFPDEVANQKPATLPPKFSSQAIENPLRSTAPPLDIRAPVDTGDKSLYNMFSTSKEIISSCIEFIFRQYVAPLLQ